MRLQRAYWSPEGVARTLSHLMGKDPHVTLLHMKNFRGSSSCWVLGALSSYSMGCYSPPISEERLQESIVITTRDETADFGAYRTFFVRPEIRVLDESTLDKGTTVDDDGTSVETELLSADLADPLIAETRENLIARGYTEASVLEGVDLGVELVYLRTIVSDYYCYYWGDWGYWGYPGATYYYPYGCTGSAWQSSMLVTNAVDLAAAARDEADQPLRGIWFSGVYGVEAESAQFVAARAVAGITQAFNQSPYFAASAPRGE
jgi:hypothetical protein